METLRFGLVIVWGLIGFGAWAAMMVHVVLVLRSSRDRWNQWSLTAARTNPLTHPELLTSQGVIYRRRLGFAMVLFFAWTVSTMIVGSAFEP
jgi:hypothetical protein